MRRGTLVVVFARNPSPGRVKRRVAAGIGDWRAARLHRRLVLRTLRIARSSGFPVALHGEPVARTAFFRACAARLGVRLEAQRGRDLGERMHRALERATRRWRRCLLIGTDCPAIGPRELRRADRLLRSGADVVLAPAEDGGYGLIGARRVREALFSGVPWGGPEVLRATLERLGQASMRARCLRTTWDVDRPGDLDRLRGLLLRRS